MSGLQGSSRRRPTTVLLAALTVLALAATAPGSVAAEQEAASQDTQETLHPHDGGPGYPDPSVLPPQFQFDGAFVTHWAREQANDIALDDTNTIPAVIPPDEPIAPDYWIWDSWPLREPDGSVAEIDGWSVLFSLSAPRGAPLVPGDRHGIAQWRYFFTNGDRWIDGGLVFPEGTAVGGRQWAGSAVYQPVTGDVTFYYTALGELPANPEVSEGSPATTPWEDVAYASPVPPGNISRQVIVETEATLSTGDDGVSFSDFGPHEIILTADGEYYVTAEQAAASQTGPYIFRDPFYFKDPATGREYLFFSATDAQLAGPKAGVAGLAYRAPGREWRLLPPVLSATETNAQVERPHIVVQDGLYYLFFTSHSFSFAPEITGPEGLYGFVSDSVSVRGHYTPLNGSGLVLGNPPTAPLQTYSWLVMPGGYVLSFINYYNLGDVTLAGIGDQSPEWQRERFGGTLAPLLELALDGETTRLADIANDGDTVGD